MWLLAVLAILCIFFDVFYALSIFINRYIKNKHLRKNKIDGIVFIITVLLNIITFIYAILILFYYILYFAFSLIGGIVF